MVCFVLIRRGEEAKAHYLIERVYETLTGWIQPTFNPFSL